MKNNHEIILKQYAAYCKEQPLYLGTAGSYGMEMLTIIREGVWAEYDILAAFHPPVGAAVQVRVGANNQIGVPIEATAEKGMGEIVFAGYKEGVRQIAVDVLYKVAPSSGASGTEPAEPTPDVVQQILKAANGAVKTADGVREDMNKVLEAESGRETAEANRAAAESARVEAETARVDAEADRAAAEKERQTAESARIAAEDDRQSAETSRARVETARESAETDRVAAEAARVNAEAERTDDERLRKDHESQRVTDETARQTAESKRQEAETARADAESKRDDAEQARVKAESTRVAAETTRKDAESKRDNAEQERQTAEKGRVAAEAKRTEDFAKIKESLDEIPKIDDTAITTTSPWSSKQIVDMLCPPLQESGNPVVCYPVAGYPLGVKASWEPVQEGSGTPSPENIRPIKGRESVTVTRCGENLLDEARFPIIKTQNNIKTTSEMTLPAGTYTVCVLSVAKGVYALGADVEYTYNSNKHTFTLARQTAIRLDAYWTKGRPENDENIWLVEGNEWRPYTPYIGSTTTLTPPETVYGGEVDAVSGDGQETWKTLTLDGTETLSNNGTVASRKEQQWAAYGIIKHYPGTFGISSHFDSIKGSLVYPFNYIRIADTSIVFHVASDGPFATVADLKAYLAAQYAAGTPVQIAYKLAKPVPFTATGAQPIPALSGTNTLLTDADSVSVSGRADLIYIIRKMQEK